MVTDPPAVIDIGYELQAKVLVLVVDDDTAIQSIIFDTLEGQYRIISAFNGREGVDKAGKTKPSLILMDVMMPDIGGYEAVRLLHDDPRTRNIPVLIMSAQNFDDSNIQLNKQEPNVVGFVTKPFKPRSLREAVQDAIDKKTGSK